MKAEILRLISMYISSPGKTTGVVITIETEECMHILFKYQLALSPKQRRESSVNAIPILKYSTFF